MKVLLMQLTEPNQLMELKGKQYKFINKQSEPKKSNALGR